MISMKKKRQKLVGVFELMLESLIEAKHLDLAEENLSDLHNSILSARTTTMTEDTDSDSEGDFMKNEDPEHNFVLANEQHRIAAQKINRTIRDARNLTSMSVDTIAVSIK